LFVLKDDLSAILNEEQKNKLERLQTRIADLVKLINTWLRAISVDVSSIRENFQPTSISVVILKARENVQNHATRKAIDIDWPDVDTTISVHGDEGTLVEAVANIIGNAVKYTRMEGNVWVRARKEMGFVHISVSDNGVGIAQEDLPHLFEDFYVGKSTTEGERRSGVGLAITRRIIEAHDGTITVDSELGKGSTFVIHLPTIED
jgi:signal transduction histidine kinase